MKQKPPIDQSLAVSKLIAAYPEVIPVFIRNRLSCIGCPMCGFDTLEDVIRIYSLDAKRFLSELSAAIGRKRKR